MSRPDLRSFAIRVAILGVVFSVGVHIDGWAHSHGRVDESFFTPWHAVLYGTYLVLAFALVRRFVLLRSQGLTWAEAVPSEWRVSLAGVAVFMLGGVGDALWHTTFGIEEDLEALLSPTHLMLAAGGVMMAVGPYVAGTRDTRSDWRGSTAAVLTTLAIWSFVAFMTQYIHPLVQLWSTPDWTFPFEPEAELAEALGVAGLTFQAVVMSVALLMLVRVRKLPPGAVTLLFGATAALAVSQGDDYWLVVPATLAGVIVDVVATDRLDGSVRSVRRFAALAPSIWAGTHLAALGLVEGVQWSPDLWGGVIVLSGLVGLLVSAAVVPPGADAAVAERPLVETTD